MVSPKFCSVMCTYPFMHDFSYTQLFSSNYVIVSECEHYRSRYASAIITIKPWASSRFWDMYKGRGGKLCALFICTNNRKKLFMEAICMPRDFRNPHPDRFFLVFGRSHIFSTKYQTSIPIYHTNPGNRFLWSSESLLVWVGVRRRPSSVLR